MARGVAVPAAAVLVLVLFAAQQAHGLSASSSLTPSSSPAPASVLAPGMMFVNSGSSFVLDSSTGGSLVQLGGTWTATADASGNQGGFLVGEYPSALTVRFTFPVRSGSYDVAVWVPSVDFEVARAARVIVFDGATGHPLTVDLAANTAQWRSLGTFQFSEGAGATAALPKVIVTTVGSTLPVVADAVRIVPVNSPSASPTPSASVGTPPSPEPAVLTVIDASVASVGTFGPWRWTSNLAAVGGSTLVGSGAEGAWMVRFSLTLVRRATFLLRLRFLVAPTNAHNAPVSVVVDGGVVVSREVDMSNSAGDGAVADGDAAVWQEIGEFVAGPDNSVFVTVTTDGTDGPVNVDAISLVEVVASPSWSPSPSPSRLDAGSLTFLNIAVGETREIDSSDRSLSALIDLDGSWLRVPSAQAKDGVYLLGRRVSGARSVTFHLSLLPGSYTILTWYVASTEGDTAVPVTVTASGVSETTRVNMQFGGAQWVTLGTFDFDGTPGSVQFSTAGTTQFLLVDSIAVRRLTGAQATTPPPQSDGDEDGSGGGNQTLVVACVAVVLVLLVACGGAVVVRMCRERSDQKHHGDGDGDGDEENAKAKEGRKDTAPGEPKKSNARSKAAGQTTARDPGVGGGEAKHNKRSGAGPKPSGSRRGRADRELEGSDGKGKGKGAGKDDEGLPRASRVSFKLAPSFKRNNDANNANNSDSGGDGDEHGRGQKQGREKKGRRVVASKLDRNPVGVSLALGRQGMSNPAADAL